MEIKHLTCIVCPIGCELEVRVTDNNRVIDVSGNTCKRGENYAATEIQNPERTLTSTVKIENSIEKFVPVKTSKPISKGRLFEAMEKISTITVSAPVKMGDVIVKNFICENIDLVICKDINNI